MPPEKTRSSNPRPSPKPRTSDEFRCLYCSGVSFRRSRLRPTDFFALMGLRFPVRCLRCSQRQLVSFSLAGISIPSNVKHHRVRSDAETWQTWTSGTAATPPPGSDASSSSTPAFNSILDSGARRRKAPVPRPRPQRDDSDEIW